jgi:hypothetical protein
MGARLGRRELLAGAAPAADLPKPAMAQSAPLKIGLLTVKTRNGFSLSRFIRATIRR